MKRRCEYRVARCEWGVFEKCGALSDHIITNDHGGWSICLRHYRELPPEVHAQVKVGRYEHEFERVGDVSACL